MKDEYSVDYSISENEASFLKGMIREYYQHEIERLTKRLEESQLAYLQVDKDKQRLQSIIKEVREYINTFDFEYLDSVYESNARLVLENILEILDKENSNE